MMLLGYMYKTLNLFAFADAMLSTNLDSEADIKKNLSCEVPLDVRGHLLARMARPGKRI